ncbi:hypothetical protein OKW76_03140 [Sphingomonas sp. S1-29]|uniref:hypothetical protein n=1 Tax=Sphingomonas sp. S1-29 TaxID=2991074 RepID=UPI00223FF93E|nr:hypothetical protein [Sphingomonas sp. S1-29]UZK70063.1 hypothetical protein OKW76_03140 [Sphingomonas sp. S1-29]
MKADEPRPPAAKYGMPIEEAPNIVRRHFQVLDEDQAIDAACMAHNMRVAPALVAVLNRRRSPEVPTPAMLAQTTPKAVSVVGHDLRVRLGLG